MATLRLGLLATMLCGCLGGPEVGEASAALATSNYCATQYPIVLMHGLYGFSSLFGILDYFFGIPATLQSCGATVYVTSVTQANTSEVRGEEVIAQLLQIQARTGAAKFNLIGHSQGGLDARYVAARRPDLVASVTSVGGPHRGSPVADVVLQSPAVVAAGGVLAELVTLMSGSSSPTPDDMKAALTTLSTAGAAQFNAAYPAALPSGCGQGAPVVAGIRYYSWGGIGWLTTGIDLTDALSAGLGSLIPDENDGLVARCSSHLGVVIRDDYFQNHFDEVDQLTGIVSPLGTDPRELFRMQGNRLQKDGL